MSGNVLKRQQNAYKMLKILHDAGSNPYKPINFSITGKKAGLTRKEIWDAEVYLLTKDFIERSSDSGGVFLTSLGIDEAERLLNQSSEIGHSPSNTTINVFNGTVGTVQNAPHSTANANQNIETSSQIVTTTTQQCRVQNVEFGITHLKFIVPSEQTRYYRYGFTPYVRNTGKISIRTFKIYMKFNFMEKLSLWKPEEKFPKLSLTRGMNDWFEEPIVKGHFHAEKKKIENKNPHLFVPEETIFPSCAINFPEGDFYLLLGKEQTLENLRASID